MQRRPRVLACSRVFVGASVFLHGHHSHGCHQRRRAAVDPGSAAEGTARNPHCHAHTVSLSGLPCLDVCRCCLIDVFIGVLGIRLVEHLKAGTISLADTLQLLVVDEADLVLSYGYALVRVRCCVIVGCCAEFCV